VFVFYSDFTVVSEPWNEAHSGLCNE